MDRRTFLTQFGLAGSLLGLSPVLMNSRALAQLKISKRQLILIELKGGNDGLNTFIPFSDPLYYTLRPNLGIKKEKLLRLNDKNGLHPSLSFLHQEMKNNRLAIIQGIGYENPNLSHFRSLDIWETGTSSDEYSDSGWLNPYLNKLSNGNPLMKGVVFGDNSFGPFRGATSDVLIMNNPKRFLRKNAKLDTYEPVKGQESLNHIISVENSLSHTMEEIRNKTKNIQLPNLTGLPKDRIAGSIRALLTILAAGHYVPIYKISIGGFDTHTEQEGTHARLLKVLDDTFHSLKNGLQSLGKWDDSLIVTYSEFGRRPKENGSRGTDHGTANVHFALGGKVKSGIYGRAPLLSDLDQEGNLKFSMDYRSYYATILNDWLQINSSKADFKWKKNAPGFIS